jgi:hypothetical protein
MSDLTPPVANHDEDRPRRRSRLWLWFVAGFLGVFVGLAVLSPAYFYDGFAVHRTKLWHYYLLEIRRAWNSSGYLGATSGNSAVAATVATQHVVLSLVGGIMLLGVGWMLNKRSRQ